MNSALSGQRVQKLKLKYAALGPVQRVPRNANQTSGGYSLAYFE